MGNRPLETGSGYHVTDTERGLKCSRILHFYPDAFKKTLTNGKKVFIISCNEKGSMVIH